MTRVAVITGTTKGLGYSTANLLLDNAYQVIGLSRSPATITHENYTHLQVDISSREAVESVFDCLQSVKINLLVNNSAVFAAREFENTSAEDIASMIDINLKGTMWVTKYALPLIQPKGRIVFVNSVSGLEELKSQSVYCATKHGLTAFAGVLGRELRPKNIKVTSIHPGGINTDLWQDNNYPCGDLAQALDPKQVADLILYISSAADNVEYKTVKLFSDNEWHH